MSWEPSRTVLVTGGAGFIGQHVVRRLANAGVRPRVLDNLSAPAPRDEDLRDAADYVVGDITDVDAVRDACRGVDTVVHLAALRSVPRSIRDPVASTVVNTVGTAIVLEEAVRASARRVVFASSSSVYGDARTLPTPESAPLAPRSPYAASKVAGEAYVGSYARRGAIEGVVLRLFNVYGPGQLGGECSPVVPAMIHAVLADAPFHLHGEHRRRDFSYVTDVAEAIWRSVVLPSGELGDAPLVVNVAGGRSWPIGEVWALLARGVPAVASPAREGDVLETCADLTRARERLGFVPTVELRDGLQRALEWASGRADHMSGARS